MKGRLEAASEQGGPEEPPWGSQQGTLQRGGRPSRAGDCQQPASRGGFLQPRGTDRARSVTAALSPAPA